MLSEQQPSVQILFPAVPSAKTKEEVFKGHVGNPGTERSHCTASLWFAESCVLCKSLRSCRKVSALRDDEHHNRDVFQVWVALAATRMAHLGCPGLQPCHASAKNCLAMPDPGALPQNQLPDLCLCKAIIHILGEKGTSDSRPAEQPVAAGPFGASSGLESHYGYLIAN